jgi:hypothetical protein
MVGRVTNVEMIFYSNRGYESGCPGRVTNSGGVD